MATTIQEENIDDLPPQKEPVIYEEGSWGKYLYGEIGANAAKLINHHRWKFSAFFGTYYVLQFTLSISAANFYSDSDRFISCGVDNLTMPADVTKVYDTSLFLLSLYHGIEWLRAAILLTIVCIGVNLTPVWYVTLLNAIFGLIAYIFCYITLFSEEGQACQEAQQYRATFLLVECILFWVVYLPFVFPLLSLMLCKKQTHE